jgi:hypothetical protein
VLERSASRAAAYGVVRWAMRVSSRISKKRIVLVRETLARSASFEKSRNCPDISPATKKKRAKPSKLRVAVSAWISSLRYVAAYDVNRRRASSSEGSR